jgi:DNA-binding transcriptional LysR family regulator
VAGVLRIGCVPDLPFQRLQGLLGALYVRDGREGTEVVHLRTPEQLNRLLTGDLDAAVIHHQRDLAGIETQLLFAGERLCAFVHVGHRLAVASPLAPGDFEQETLLVGPRAIDPPLHDRLMGALDAAGFRFRAVRQVGGGDPRDILLAAAEGRGVAIAPASTLDVVGGADAIVSRCEIEPALLGPDTLIAWRTDASARVADLIAAARELQST